MPGTDTLVQFIHTPHARLNRPLLRERAVRYLIDTLAVTVAGSTEPAVATLLDNYATLQMNGTPLPWTARTLSTDDACLVFGTASHVLDYDDVSMLAVCHPSAPIVTVLNSLAHLKPMSGAELVDAFIVGTEVLIRTGQAMGFRHYELGFHATATLGALGAAACSARVLGLTATQTRHALSIAASQSAGLRKNFGSMVKSLHVGLAASHGLQAARLAQAGVEGSHEAFMNGGWLHAYSGGETDRWPDGFQPGNPTAIEETGFEQKRFPCCYMTHKIITAALALKTHHGLTLDTIEQIDVQLCKGGTTPLIHPRPTTGLHAKFSAPYTVLAALADGRVNLASFEEGAVMRPEIQARLDDVRVGEDTAPLAHGNDVGKAPATVTVQTRDGHTLSHTVVASPGSPDDPLSDADLAIKWADCLRHTRPDLTPATTHTLFATGLDLDNVADAGRWLRLETP